MTQEEINSSYRARGLASGIERASETLLNLSLKKRQLAQDDERFNTEMKIKNLQLKQLEGEADPEVIENNRIALKNAAKVRSALSQQAADNLEYFSRGVAKQKQAFESELGNEINYQKGRIEGQRDMSSALNVGGLMVDPEATLNAKDGQIKFTNGRENRLQRQAEFANTTKLREEFINRPEVKDYINIETQVRSMEGLLNSAKAGNMQNKAALDQGLITMFNKLTDPNSVVRESEYARTPENLPVLNRFSGAIQKVQQGGAGLTNEDREALVWGAKVIADQRGETFNRTLKSYDELSQDSGLDSSKVLRGLSPHRNFINGQESISRGSSRQYTDEEKSNYNSLRASGVSAEEAKKRLGL